MNVRRPSEFALEKVLVDEVTALRAELEGETNEAERPTKKAQLDEKYRIEMARVPPADYDKFGQFAGEVDLVQGREMLAEKK